MHDRQIEVVQEAIREGLDPARLTTAQYSRLRLKIRSKGEIVADATKLGVSKLKTAIGYSVTREKIAENERTCYNCPGKKFRELIQVKVITIDGKRHEERGPMVPACDACNCSGTGLISKWSDPAQECPDGYWTNRKGAAPVGDFSRGP